MHRKENYNNQHIYFHIIHDDNRCSLLIKYSLHSLNILALRQAMPNHGHILLIDTLFSPFKRVMLSKPVMQYFKL